MHRTPSSVLALTALLALAGAAPAAAQGEHAADHHGMASAEGMPDGWLMRFDRAAATADMVSFSTMDPGWHATTGRAGSGIFWQPDMATAGDFAARTKIHLMKPAEHAEAFGLFLGGRDLGAEGQAYVYFLVRQNGQFLIKRRNGSETETLVDWTAHEAVPTASADGSTAYTLSVDVGADQVVFGVNGATVHTLPKAELDTDGIVGVRINHMLDVHVEELVARAGA